jgi:NAD(P)-dependent dehydrogenase (short-subunit alcohol dehydrogenase family)
MTTDQTDTFEAELLERLRPDSLFSLEGRVAVITGAAGGIGSWLSAGFAGAGAAVMLTDLDIVRTRAVADAIASRGMKTAALAVDLRDDDAADRIVQGTTDRFGRLDIVVNNAAINQRVPILDVSAELLDEILRIDYVRCYQLAQSAARVMIPRGGGCILNISSLNNHVGLEDVSLNGPTKAALSQLTKVQAIEWARYHIRSNALAPGFMATPMNAAHWTHETRAPWIMGRTPLCRPGHPSELIGAALLLVSDAGSFITGQTLYVDGGFMAGSRWNVAPLAGYEAYLDQVAAEARPTG